MARFTSGLGLVLLIAGLGATGCSGNAGGDDGYDNAVSESQFNKNHALDDDVLLDDRALTEAKIQTFLDATPFGTQSPLADYHDKTGRAASTILFDASSAYGVNAIELLVRLQMEFELVSGETPGASRGDASVDAENADDAQAADYDAWAEDAGPPSHDGGLAEDAAAKAAGGPSLDEKIAQAFNCGRVMTFEAQASCAAKSVARGMNNIKIGKAAPGGWKPNVQMKTQDNIAVKPVNAATAVLYAYTPYVGEKGGGEKGTAGVSGHVALWNQFAKALKYKGATCAVGSLGSDAGASCGECRPGHTEACTAEGKGASCLPSHTCGCSRDADCGGAGSGRACNLQTQACETSTAVVDGGSADDAGALDAGFHPLDGGKPAKDAGGADDAGIDNDAGSLGSGSGDGSEDDGTGHQTGSGGGSYGSGGHGSGTPHASGGGDDGSDAGPTTNGHGGKKKGCSAAGGGTGEAGSFGLLLGIVAIATRRRRATRS